jgi:cytochrome b subunit of formate dehydrogenase
MENTSKIKSIESLLVKTQVPVDSYRVDVELFDRGQKLSAELLRLSLAGIAVVGFFLTNILANSSAHSASNALKLYLSGAVLTCVLSSLFSLLQAFFASGAMFHHINAIKLTQLEDQALNDALKKSLSARTTKFNAAHRLLIASAIFLVIAACLLGMAFIEWMYS